MRAVTLATWSATPKQSRGLMGGPAGLAVPDCLYATSAGFGR
jgi:hypothetical protein